METDIKLNDSITRRAFIGFVVFVVFIYLSVVPIIWAQGLADEALQKLLYIIVVAAILIMEIERPGIFKFLTIVFKTIADRNVSNEQKVQILLQAIWELCGLYMDLSHVATGLEKTTAPQGDIKTAKTPNLSPFPEIPSVPPKEAPKPTPTPTPAVAPAPKDPPK